MRGNSMSYVDAGAVVSSDILAGLQLGALVRAEAWEINAHDDSARLVLTFATDNATARAILAIIGAAVRATSQAG